MMWKQHCNSGYALNQKHLFADGFKNLVRCWENCVAKKGDYVEKLCNLFSNRSSLVIKNKSVWWSGVPHFWPYNVCPIGAGRLLKYCLDFAISVIWIIYVETDKGDMMVQWFALSSQNSEVLGSKRFVQSLHFRCYSPKKYRLGQLASLNCPWG